MRNIFIKVIIPDDIEKVLTEDEDLKRLNDRLPKDGELYTVDLSGLISSFGLTLDQVIPFIKPFTKLPPEL